ncbi:GTP-binding protein [Kriegella sp. EG-1]|nr:GTP-binding protein [Flavobacteriaceae bacterium EG-1]
MKPLSNDIVLRPRFHLEIPKTKEKVLNSFENIENCSLNVKRIDEHIFIKFKKEQNNFWSPQLHLEIDELSNNSCRVNGVFGPNPVLWTFFMFIHFTVACLFIIMAIWGYSSATLNKPYALQLILMAVMVILWFTLYLFGRAGKHSGKPQMLELYEFMNGVLS